MELVPYEAKPINFFIRNERIEKIYITVNIISAVAVCMSKRVKNSSFVVLPFSNEQLKPCVWYVPYPKTHLPFN